MPRFLPPELRGSAIRTSGANDHDLTRWRMRARDVDHPHHGVSAFDLNPDSLRDRAAAFLPVMEAGQTFSHTTALDLHGAPLPSQPQELHVSVVFPRTPPRRPGISGHSLTDSPATLLDGMPVTPAAVAWAQSAALLAREDVVAVGDYLVLRARRRALASLEQLTRIAETWHGRPGALRLAWAVPRLRLGVRSRPETHLRLLLVRYRLPEPVVAHPVPVANGLVLHPDLAYPEHRLAIEYEGDGHRSRKEWERDIERRELLAEAGWRTVQVTSTHLRDPRGLVSRVRRYRAI
jgi:very-short-patch-repair endonuclease